jgi:ABC-type sugar transport system substrate-binding protein
MKKTLALILVLLLAAVPALAASNEIAFLPPAMTSPFYASCIEGAQPVAEAAGYTLTVMRPKWRRLWVRCS